MQSKQGRAVTESSQQTRMRALVQRGYGGEEVLHVEDVEVPSPGPGEVLVRVRAASVNHADWVMTSGTPLIARLAFGLRRPRSQIRGKDIAGVVQAVGSDVTRFAPGDSVYGEADSGGFAEYACVPAERLGPMPATLTFEQAAAVPLAGNTALQGLRDAGRLAPGQHVAVVGASGGVGTFAVQLAKAFGAEVTAVCSTRNVALVRSLGADHVVDYSREDFTASPGRYDLIFDVIGDRSLRDCLRALRPNGTLVLSSGTGSRTFGPMGRILRALAMAPFTSRRVVAGWAPKRRPGDGLRELLDSGQVVPAIDRVYPLADAQAAMWHFVHDHARGKIIVTVGP